MKSKHSEEVNEWEPLKTLSVEEILTYEPQYRAGQILRFVCGNLIARLAGHTFKAKDTIRVKLCTDWDGEEFESRPFWPWHLIGGKKSFSARTLYRIAEEIWDESTEWLIWSRDDITQGTLP